MRITIDSTEKEILDFCEQESHQAPGYGHEMKLDYGFNLYAAKQQQKMLQEQNMYNGKQLFWSRILAIATIALVIATFLLIKFS